MKLTSYASYSWDSSRLIGIQVVIGVCLLKDVIFDRLYRRVSVSLVIGTPPAPGLSFDNQRDVMRNPMRRL